MNRYNIFSCVSLMLLLSGPLICSSKEDLPKIGGLDLTMPEETSYKTEDDGKSSNTWLIPAGLAAAGATAACYYCISSYWSTPKVVQKCASKVESQKSSVLQQPTVIEAEKIVSPNTLITCDKTIPINGNTSRRIVAEEFITYTENRRIVHYEDFTYFPEQFEKKQNKEL